MKNPFKIQINPEFLKVIQEIAEKKKLQQKQTTKKN